MHIQKQEIEKGYCMKTLFIVSLSVAGFILLCCIGMYIAGLIFGIYKQFKDERKEQNEND